MYVTFDKWVSENPKVVLRFQIIMKFMSTSREAHTRTRHRVRVTATTLSLNAVALLSLERLPPPTAPPHIVS